MFFIFIILKNDFFFNYSNIFFLFFFIGNFCFYMISMRFSDTRGVILSYFISKFYSLKNIYANHQVEKIRFWWHQFLKTTKYQWTLEHIFLHQPLLFYYNKKVTSSTKPRWVIAVFREYFGLQWWRHSQCSLSTPLPHGKSFFFYKNKNRTIQGKCIIFCLLFTLAKGIEFDFMG